MQIQTIRGDDEAFSVEMDGEHVAIDIEVDDNFPTITTYRFSKEAAQALGTALLAAASGGDTRHRVYASWNDGFVEVTFVPGWLQIDYDRWCLGFNASEAKALLAAVASCVAAMDATEGGDGDDNQ